MRLMVGPRVMDRDTLQTKLYAGQRFHLWNVVSPEIFEPHRNIPGSRWVPVHALEDHASLLNIDKDEEIVLYSRGGDCRASRAAAQRLCEMGYIRVFDYMGGLHDWVEAGLPVSTLDYA